MEKFFKRLCVYLSYILIFVTAISVFAIPVYAKSEKKIDFFSASSIAENIKNMELNMTSAIYVKNEKGDWVEYQRLHGNENRIWVSIDKMPKDLLNAFIAIEDERFEKHRGVDWKRTLGAIGNYIFKFNDKEFGGSTITQQLIKNVSGDDGRNALRKIREIVRASLVETKLSKKQILEAYLNTISLGNGICGVQVASNYYFNKDVSELTLNECAALAAITQNPVKHNPITGMESNNSRRAAILTKMLELEFIDFKKFSSSYDKPIKLDVSQKTNLEAEINNYFVDTLIEEVISDLAKEYKCSEDIASTMLYNGGYKIYSTINPEIQSTMENVYLNTSKYFYLKGKNAEGERVGVQSAMTIMDYSGHIVGIVGGVGEKTVNRGLNRATGAPRQPGSTMKPIGVYALAIEKDIVNYSSKVLDQPIKNYRGNKSGPNEWYGYYKGDISLNYAIRKSANTIPVRLLQKVGIDTSYEFLTQKLGLKYLNEADKNLASLALGGCTYGMTTTESAAAYAIFGNGGKFFEPTTYYKIEKMTGELVLESDTKGNQVISPSTATIMNHLLQEVVYGSEGTGSGIRGFNYSMKAYAKTGTSSESNDLWMVAGSPYYVGSVWYGFDMPQQVRSTSAAATVWRDIMKQVHKGLEKKTFTDSEDVYKKNGGYYKKGTTPGGFSYNPDEVEKEETSSNASTSSTTSTSKPTTSTSTPTDSTTTTPSDTDGNENSGGTESGDSTSTPTESTPESTPQTPPPPITPPVTSQNISE